jgi:SP family facilitated glucose transporter-like MFS transporter 8
MPETPIWLLSRGRYEDAEKALCWLRGWVTPDVVREEFNQLVIYSNTVNKTKFPVITTDSVTVSVRGNDNHIIACAKLSN